MLLGASPLPISWGVVERVCVQKMKVSVQHLLTDSSTWLTVGSGLSCCVVEVEQIIPRAALPGQGQVRGTAMQAAIPASTQAPTVYCLLLDQDFPLGLSDSLALSAPTVLWCLWFL